MRDHFGWKLWQDCSVQKYRVLDAMTQDVLYFTHVCCLFLIWCFGLVSFTPNYWMNRLWVKVWGSCLNTTSLLICWYSSTLIDHDKITKNVEVLPFFSEFLVNWNKSLLRRNTKKICYRAVHTSAGELHITGFPVNVLCWDEIMNMWVFLGWASKNPYLI